MVEFRNPIITAALIHCATEALPARMNGIHGLPHWVRVERNGLFIAGHNEADPAVVSLFALFHDCRRFNDDLDPGHGVRGADLARELHTKGLLPIDSHQLELLLYACAHHTDEHFHDDVTVGACWDADRLDLTRLEIDPDPELLNTSIAKEVARTRDYTRLAQY